uniref:Uncharacterized protein n=1 Tax=Panagrolaimus sp. ES5 TaxID=591445 RepID=A0AC34GDL3_9BILA
RETLFAVATLKSNECLWISERNALVAANESLASRFKSLEAQFQSLEAGVEETLRGKNEQIALLEQTVNGLKGEVKSKKKSTAVQNLVSTITVLSDQFSSPGAKGAEN